MLTFKQFLTERFKSKHEDKIRQLASKAREEYMAQNTHTSRAVAQTEYGDCENVSHCVVKHLLPHYPSARVTRGNFYGKTTSGLHDDEGMSGHAWVEIPEIHHYVDASHDQFRYYGKQYPRESIPQRGGRFPDNAIRIAPMHKKHYHGYGYRPDTPPGARQDAIDSGEWKHMTTRQIYGRD